MFAVAIDGPAAAGKGTISKRVAAHPSLQVHQQPTLVGTAYVGQQMKKHCV